MPAEVFCTGEGSVTDSKDRFNLLAQEVYYQARLVRFVPPSKDATPEIWLDPQKLGFGAYRKIELPALPKRRYLHRHPGYLILKVAWNPATQILKVTINTFPILKVAQT